MTTQQWKSNLPKKRPGFLEMYLTYGMSFLFLLLCVCDLILTVMWFVHLPESPMGWMSLAVTLTMGFLCYKEYSKADKMKRRRDYGEYFYPNGI